MIPSRSNRQKAFGLIGLLLITFAAPALSSFIPMPGEWYDSLQKPSWNPPAWLFGPVWGALYTFMAIAAWLVWLHKGLARPLHLYMGQLAVNAAWTPVFFGLHRIDMALGVIVVLWLAVLMTMLAFFRVRAGAGWLLVAYLLWVSFATFLNFTLWRLNS
ncbi:MAG TPA: TspO/MBR family protein [Prosthecobacter sp.]